MEKDFRERKGDYWSMILQVKSEKQRFLEELQKDHTRVLNYKDSLVYETRVFYNKLKLGIATVVGAGFSVFLLYKLDIKNLPNRQLHSILYLAFFLPVYFAKIYDRNGNIKQLEEYFFIKYNRHGLFEENNNEA